MATAAVVLAAGRGSRLESAVPKPLLAYRGRPLVDWALDAARAGGCDPVVLVVGHAAEAVATRAAPGTVVVRADGWAHGISQSLRAALDALDRPGTVPGSAGVTAVCVGLADQPRVGPEAYRRLAAAGEAGAALAVATYAGVRGNPVLLGRPLWDAARGLTGDEGARQLMRTHPVVEVDCTGTGDPADVDTLGDLQALDDDCVERATPPGGAASCTEP